MGALVTLVTPAALRISVAGLAEPDASHLRACVDALPDWEIGDSHFQALVADPHRAEAIPVLRDRPLGTVVLLVVARGDRQLPGTISLVRPFDDADVRTALDRVQALIDRRSSVLANAARVGEAMRTASESRRQESAALQSLNSLFDLAVCFRDRLVKELSVVVRVHDRRFHLFPQHRRYWSDTPLQSLDRYRGSSDVDLRVEILGAVDPERLRGGGYLDDFACHLGFRAGNGALFPWIDADAAHRVIRWPSVGSSRVAAMLSMGAATVRDVESQTSAPKAQIHDFLNACSLAGWLQVSAAPRRAANLRVVAPAQAAAAKRPPVQRSLLAKIRERMGIAS